MTLSSEQEHSQFDDDVDLICIELLYLQWKDSDDPNDWIAFRDALEDAWVDGVLRRLMNKKKDAR